MAWYDDAWSFISDTTQNIGDGIADAATTSWEWISGTASDAADSIDSAYDTVTNWVNDQLTTARNWVIEKIIAITEEIRVLKYKFRQAVSKWMENPVLFWLTIAGVIGLVIVAPYVLSYLSNTAVWVTVQAAYAYIKDTAGSLLDKLGYIQLLDIHKIFLLINPEYTSFWSSLDEAFMGLAEEIEIGVGTLNTLTDSVRNLYYATYTMMGVDCDTIETKFYDDATRFWSKAQSDWEKYVRNPQAIFDDIKTELVYPVLTEQAQFGIDRAKHELEAAKKLDDTIINIDNVRIAFDDLVEALPDDIEEIITDKIGEFQEGLDTFFEDKITPFREKLEDSIGVIDDEISGMEEAIYINSLRRPSSYDTLITLLFDGTLDIAEKREKISLLFNDILNKDNAELIDNEMKLIALEPNDSGIVVKEEEKEEGVVYESLFTLDMSKIRASAEGWFVGEY